MRFLVRSLLFTAGSLVMATASANSQQLTLFTPATSLTFAGPGTYTGQYLGKLSGNPLSAGGKVQAAVLGGISGIALANLSLTGNPPDGSAPDGNNYIYGDIAVTNRSTISAGVMLSVFQGTTQMISGLDVVSLQGGAPAGCAKDATATVTITARPVIPIWGTDLSTAVVTVKNTGSTSLAGPLELSLAGLSGNAGLFAAAGTGTCPVDAGLPYQFVAAQLAPGESKDMLVIFTNSQVPTATITYTPKLLAGGSLL